MITRYKGFAIQSLHFISLNRPCHCSNPHEQFLRVLSQLLSNLCISCAQLFHYNKRINATLFHTSSIITYLSLLKISQQFVCLHLINGPPPNTYGGKRASTQVPSCDLSFLLGPACYFLHSTSTFVLMPFLNATEQGSVKYT